MFLLVLSCFFRRRKQIAPTALAPLRSENYELCTMNYDSAGTSQSCCIDPFEQNK